MVHNPRIWKNLEDECFALDIKDPLISHVLTVLNRPRNLLEEKPWPPQPLRLTLHDKGQDVGKLLTVWYHHAVQIGFTQPEQTFKYYIPIIRKEMRDGNRVRRVPLLMCQGRSNPITSYPVYPPKLPETPSLSPCKYYRKMQRLSYKLFLPPGESIFACGACHSLGRRSMIRPRSNEIMTKLIIEVAKLGDAERKALENPNDLESQEVYTDGLIAAIKLYMS